MRIEELQCTIVLLVKCIFILLFFGIILPKTIEYILISLQYPYHSYNVKLVSGIKTGYDIVSNFQMLFHFFF